MKIQASKIDGIRKRVLADIKAAKKVEAGLIKKGCQKGKIHFRNLSSGSRPMLIVEPVCDGKRAKIYIGVDPEKQAIAKAMVEREIERQKTVEDYLQLEQRLNLLDSKLSYLISDYENI